MIQFTGTVWRMAFKGCDPLAPAQSPVGRFHHSGQWALYTSLSAEGTAVAIQRYMRPEDSDRVIHPLHVCTDKVIDLRGQEKASVIWQHLTATGTPSPTWQYSDRARDLGAEAMLYSSRSRPELSHLVVFSSASIEKSETLKPREWTSSTGFHTTG